VTVSNSRIFNNNSRGAGMTEVLLAMAIVAMSAPFVYNQIARTNHVVRDVRAAREIVATRAPALNFVRMHADAWPDVAQIRLADDELAAISETSTAGFIDKYQINGATVTDVYLGFNIPDGALHASHIAAQIGVDAAVVGDDGIAYGQTWAVSAPDFMPGDLVFRITRDVAGIDTEKFLHRGTSGDDDLNVMARDLNMGGFNVFDLGRAASTDARVNNASAEFITTDDLTAASVYFSAGANIDGGTVNIGAMRVTGDITGFRNITAGTLNGAGYTTRGRIIADRATISDAVNVSHDLTLKSDSARTISGFDGITVGYVAAPLITADQIIFYENFGLTLSGELLMSTTPPLKIGSWTFPSTTPPKFSSIEITRASIPAAPGRAEFAPILGTGWKDIRTKNETTANVF